LDEYVQSHLILAAITICSRILQRGGTFVAKVFRSRDSGLLGAQLRCLFDGPVTFAKPRSSRNSSLEAFVVCQEYSGPRLSTRSHTDSTTADPLLLQWYNPANFDEFSEDHKAILPFVACGDLCGFDADLCYTLDPDHVCKPPIQMPIDPAYADVCRRARVARAQEQGKEDDVVEQTVSSLMDALSVSEI
uniref:FtsJ domain-containing protein n=1 Tax=Echinostoma caproni TaxID=27848 RepID=A0A183B5G5_9TREM